MSCRICSLQPCQSTCRRCLEVQKLVEQHRGPKPLLLVVDGSVTMESKVEGGRPSGAGLVLAESHDRILATAAIPLICTSSLQAELTAVIKASQWAPGVTIWTDIQYWSPGRQKAIDELPVEVRYIAPELRYPLHNTAHNLANAARLRDEYRLTTMKVYGDVHRDRRRFLGTNVVEYSYCP